MEEYVTPLTTNFCETVICALNNFEGEEEVVALGVLGKVRMDTFPFRSPANTQPITSPRNKKPISRVETSIFVMYHFAGP